MTIQITGQYPAEKNAIHAAVEDLKVKGWEVSFATKSDAKMTITLYQKDEPSAFEESPSSSSSLAYDNAPLNLDDYAILYGRHFGE